MEGTRSSSASNHANVPFFLQKESTLEDYTNVLVLLEYANSFFFVCTMSELLFLQA